MRRSFARATRVRQVEAGELPVVTTSDSTFIFAYGSEGQSSLAQHSGAARGAKSQRLEPPNAHPSLGQAFEHCAAHGHCGSHPKVCQKPVLW